MELNGEPASEAEGKGAMVMTMNGFRLGFGRRRSTVAMAIATFSLCAAFTGFASSAFAALAQPPAADPAKSNPAPGSAPAVAKPKDAGLLPRQYGDETPTPFVPARPRTVEDRKEVEAMRDFAAARALEKRKEWGKAVQLYEKLLKEQPDSISVLRRLSELNFARGYLARGVEYAKKVVEHDPGDTNALQRIMLQFVRNGDFAGMERFLKSLTANPKLGKKSGAYLYIQRELGAIYADTNRLDQAADAFGQVIDGLDDKSIKMSPHDLQRVLGNPPLTYQMIGVVLLNANRPDAALRAFERGLAYDAEDLGLRMGLARALTQRGDSAKALETIERILAEQPKTSEPYRMLGEVLTKLKREKEILPKLEQALAADRDNYALLLVMAEQYAAEGQSEKAKGIWSRVLEARPNPAQLLRLAQLLQKEKQAPELVKALAIASARRESFQVLQLLLAQLLQDRAFAQNVLKSGVEMIAAEPSKIEKAAEKPLAETLRTLANQLNDADSMIRLDQWKLKSEPSRDAYIQLSEALERAKRSEEAAKLLVEFAQKAPEEKDGELQVRIAQAWSNAGKKDLASTAAREAVKAAKNEPNIQRVAAYLLSRSDQHEEAVKVARELVQTAPNDPKLRNLLFLVLNNAKRLEEALEAARDAFKTNESDPDYMAMVGEALEKLQRDDEAVAHYKLSLEKFPNNREIETRIGQRLSALHVNRDHIAQGQEVLERMLEKYPDDSGINNDLGYLYADQGKNLDQAERMVRKALEDDPDNSAFLDSLGWVLFKRDKIDEAIKHLERAAVNYPIPDGDPTILDHLGDAYFRKKDYPKARDAWKRAEASARRQEPPDKRLPEIGKKFKLLEKAEAMAGGSQGRKP